MSVTSARNRSSLAGLLLGIASMAGCAAALGRAAGEAAPEAVSQSLAQLQTPEGQRDLEHFMTSPAVKEGTRQLAEVLGSAFLHSLAAPENREALHRIGQELGLSITDGSLEELTANMTPEQRDALLRGTRTLFAEGSEEVAKGFTAGLAETVSPQSDQDRTLRGRARQAVTRGAQWILAGTLLLLVLLILAVLFLLRMRTKYQKERDAWLAERLAERQKPAASTAATLAMLRELLQNPEARSILVDQLRHEPPEEGAQPH